MARTRTGKGNHTPSIRQPRCWDSCRRWRCPSRRRCTPGPKRLWSAAWIHRRCLSLLVLWRARVMGMGMKMEEVGGNVLGLLRLALWPPGWRLVEEWTIGRGGRADDVSGVGHSGKVRVLDVGKLGLVWGIWRGRCVGIGNGETGGDGCSYRLSASVVPEGVRSLLPASNSKRSEAGPYLHHPAHFAWTRASRLNLASLTLSEHIQVLHR